MKLRPTTIDQRSKNIHDRHVAMRSINANAQLWDSFKAGGGAVGLGAGLLVGSVALPFLSIPLAIGSAIFMGIGRKRKMQEVYDYPLYTPKHSKRKQDPIDINPGNRKPRAPRAILYMGVEPSTQRQAWLTDEVTRQHFWMQATTGGGKTEGLVGLATNFFCYGSGFLMLDGKADMKLPAKVCSLAHRFMRSNSVFLLNYITGNESPWGNKEKERSSSINPFLTGSVGSLSELVKSLLQDDGDIWSKRAMSFIDALTRVLVYLRDQGEVQFNITHYGIYLQLEELGKLAGRNDIPMSVKRELYQFVKTLPGLDADGFKRLLNGSPLDPKKSQQPFDQLGYITMQVIPVINMLQGDYGYIFETVYGSINIRDIVMKRRILIVLLPALEKAAPSLKALGQLVVALIRDLLASGIGNDIEGDIDKALKRRFTNDIAPYFAIFDEAGYYFVPDAFAPIFAQARSIGMSCIMGSQDDYAMEKGGEQAAKEVGTVRANTNTKIIGKIEDTDGSMEKVLARISEVTVYEEKELEREFGSSRYVGTRVSAETKTRLTKEDFLALREGEVYIIHQDREVRVDMFAAFPPELKNQQANVLVPSGLVSKQREERLTTNYKQARATFTQIDRGKVKLQLKPLQEPYSTALNSLTLDKGMLGICRAMKSLDDNVQQRIMKHMEVISRSKEVTEEQVALHSEENRAYAQGIDNPYADEFGDEAEATEVEEQSEAPASSARRSKYVTMFDTVFERKSPLQRDLEEANVLSAAANKDLSEAETARTDSINTTRRVGAAVDMQHPGPPPIQLSKEGIIQTLEKMRNLMDTDTD